MLTQPPSGSGASYTADIDLGTQEDYLAERQQTHLSGIGV